MLLNIEYNIPEQTTLGLFYNRERCWREATSRKSKRRTRTEVFGTNTLSRKTGGQEQITFFIHLKVNKKVHYFLYI